MKRFASDDRGVAALEYALVLPLLLGFALGVVDLGRLFWSQVSMDRAVQAAARCASVNPTACGSDGAIKIYAAGEAWGVVVPAASFAVTRPACGVSVSATAPFQFTGPWPLKISTVNSSACYPVS